MDSNQSAPEPPTTLDVKVRARVADDLDATFLVEAGAGTGKTTVLLQRLLTLIRTGRSRLDHIAAITFTEKAAAELRIRLRMEINTALHGLLSAEEQRNLREARFQLERAEISTLHAFCAALLRERPVEAQVDPDFTVLDQFAADLLQTEVWREWLAQEMEGSPVVLKRALRAGLTLAHLEVLRDFVTAHRDCLVLLPAEVGSLLPEFRATLIPAAARLQALGESCRNKADRAYLQIADVDQLFPDAEDESAWERLLVQSVPISGKVGTAGNWKKGALDEMRAVFRQIEEARARAHAAWAHNLTVLIVRWLNGFLQAYAERKRAQASLDFLDLLVCARDLLKHNLDVRRAFQRRFDALLVDEFQDTDPLQTEIIFFLAEREPRATEWTAVDVRPGKLFAVGDPRQSIYRFRRADLEVYAQARNTIARQGTVLSLFTNFRARPSTLAWINDTFTRLSASDEEKQQAYPVLTAARQEDSEPGVIILPVPATLVSVKPKRDELRHAEASTVAAFLKKMIGQNDQNLWPDRAIRYRDVAILFRTHQGMEAYEDALQSAGVPYRVFGGRRYTSRQEIEELRAVLRAIDQPSDTVAVVATLRSALFGISDAELAAFVGAGGVLDYMIPPDVTTPTAKRLSAAFAVLRDFHARCAEVSPATLLYELYNQTHLLPLFALRPQGVQRVANLLKLLDTARALSTQGYGTLTALNRFLAQQDEMAEEEEALVVEDQDDAVRLLTIHKAKGLEFPIVVLADTARASRRFSRIGIVNRVAGCLDVRIGPHSLACRTQGWQPADAREQERDAAEEQRLWYVAATRARDCVIVPVTPLAHADDEEAQETLSSLMVRDYVSNAGVPSHQEGVRSAERGEDQSFCFAGAATGVHIYHLDADRVEHTAPRFSSAPVITQVESDYAALQTYQEWEAKRRAVIAQAQGGERIITLAPSPSMGEGKGEGARMGTPSPLSHSLPRGEREQKAVLTRSRTATECFTNLPFVLHTQNCLLEGSIDLAFVEDEQWVIGVFTTDTVTNTAAAETQALAHRPRLYLSALALERLTGRSVSTLVLLYTGVSQEVHFPWNDQARTEAEALLLL